MTEAVMYDGALWLMIVYYCIKRNKGCLALVTCSYGPIQGH